MSMFHELMMRKKEQIMYATIKGSLTENNGVFSGFSASNYLQLQQAIPILDANSSFEISLKMTMPDVSSTVFVLGDDTGSNNDINIRITTTKLIYGYIYDTTNSNKIFRNISASNIQEGDDLYIKYSISGGKLTIKVSSDNINWEENSIALPSDFAYTKGLLANIGGGVSVFASLSGTIDLNNSYIKIGATKYKLQAVVGYTVVGSPTITDGVVSGFSNSNYLKIDKTINANKIEISVPFSFDTLNWNDIFWGMSSNQLNLLAELNNTGSLIFYFRQGFSSGNINSYTSLSINTNYRVNITLTYDNFVYKIINEDTNTIVKESTIERTTKATPYLGIPAFGRSAPNTTIAIKDTTIKAYNKLWFNGQQA